MFIKPYISINHLDFIYKFLTIRVLIGGAIYEVGSWLYDVVASWLKSDTARDIIAKKKKGSILREFPSEYLDKTLDEIEKDAKKGVPNAKKAKKLLTDKRFDLTDKRFDK